MREDEPPKDLETRMRCEHAEYVKAMEDAVKPKTLGQMIEEYELEMTED